jgi:hypothetical protein
MANLKSTLQAGALFPQAARSNFMQITGQRYRAMCERHQRKKLPKPDFTLDELRRDLLKVMGGEDDAPLQCRYCGQWFPLEEVAFDHCTPLSRLGSSGLDNMDYPCGKDNDIKGSLTVAEYQQFLSLMMTMDREARKDVLLRLEKANKLLASARRLQAVLAENDRLKKELDQLRNGARPQDTKTSRPIQNVLEEPF